MNETKNETYYKKFLNKRRKFNVDLGYKYPDGSKRPSKLGGEVREVLNDRLVVFDERSNKTMTLKFEIIDSDAPMEEDDD